VDLKAINQKIDKELGIQTQLKAFGRTRDLMLECSSADFFRLAAWLRSEDSTRLDWLDNLSATEVKSKVVLTYFLRSRALAHGLILKTETPLDDRPKSALESVVSVWPMAQVFEEEITALFGVAFKNGVPATDVQAGYFGKPGEYPLRKDYAWETGM